MRRYIKCSTYTYTYTYKKRFNYVRTIHPRSAMYDGRAEEVVPVSIRLQSTILVCRPAKQRIARAELVQYVNVRSSSP